MHNSLYSRLLWVSQGLEVIPDTTACRSIQSDKHETQQTYLQIQLYSGTESSSSMGKSQIESVQSSFMVNVIELSPTQSSLLLIKSETERVPRHSSLYSHYSRASQTESVPKQSIAVVPNR
ncbi:hypothetical protein DPMN_092671 [Dreissena polymorpha]|uniref:Uncharacterized protein n=1 Tax=Dreissena polymorpha TaxID=45954 RepID=A0A9D4L2Q9_DREPO|nr:hypothetical protein DPMN_092671 [Dreissena polymorpha]